MIEKYVCPSCQESIEWDDSSCERFVVCPHCGGQFESPNAPMFQKGTQIGDYIIEKLLGVGGMGEVYLAEQQSMMRPVALKVLHSDLIEDQSYLERFYREVRTLAKIEHPNIVKAIETGYEDNIYYFSMSYIQGNDLKHRLDNQGKMSEIDALYVILNVAEALKFVWTRHRLIHRDIKPANIILTDEHEVKLMDLGISKVVSDDRSGDLTMAGMMVGSPYYISPEQARAEQDIDWRADMYSLGASFYHMIVGSLPFDAVNPMGIISAHLSKPIPDPRLKNPKITDKSANIIGRMMQKDKERRFASWDDAIDAINDAIETLSGGGAETTILSAVDPQKKKKPQKKSKDSNNKPPLSAIVNKFKNAVSKFPKYPQANENKKQHTGTKQQQVDTGIRKLFGNLYIRFIILVILLFITFLSFFKVVKKSIHEVKVKKAKASIEQYISARTEMSKTKRGRKDLYSQLMNIKKIGMRKSSEWADAELKRLQKIAFKEQNQRRIDDTKLALNRLKERSYTFEKKGEIDNALEVWREYKADGAFADDLQDEITKAIDYLMLKKRKKQTSGIE
jgi:serine/threonine-protein kinase